MNGEDRLYTLDTACYNLCFQYAGGGNVGTRPFGEGLGQLCAVVAAGTAAEMGRQVRAALREAVTLELRIDWLASDAERARFLAWLGRNRPRQVTLLVTCRRRAAGGRFAGNIEAQLFWLIQAREAGCQWCDIEIETLRALPDQSIREYAGPAL